MLLGHLAIVLGSTRQFPYADEVNLLAGPLTPGWLLQLYVDHRVPVAKLLWLGGLKLTGYDFRAVAVFSVLSVAATAAAMIVGAVRGCEAALNIPTPSSRSRCSASGRSRTSCGRG